MQKKGPLGNKNSWSVTAGAEKSGKRGFFGSFLQLSTWTRTSVWTTFAVLCAFSLIGLVFALVLIWQASRSLPSLENLEKIEPALISRVYDDDSVLIHEFYTERRIWTEYNRIPQRLVQAVMAIEDRAYFDHWGVNLSAYPSAVLPALFGGRARGASTLTQQLAKNLFLTPERSILRKIRELILAINIERTYTKEEILEFYLNEVYLGAGAYGFQSASQKYFSKPLDSLKVQEYALLAGLLQRPESYRPDNNPEAALTRRNIVLRAMEDEGFITKAEMVTAITSDIHLDIWYPGSLTAPYFVETIRQFLEEKWDAAMIYGKGVNIYSTLNRDIQQVADSAFQDHLANVRRRIQYATARNLNMPAHLKMKLDDVVRDWDSTYARFERDFINSEKEKKRRETGAKLKFPDSLQYREAQGAVIVIENRTGAVKALIGGESFEKSKFNRALQARRSPGSSFKPIVYTAALDNGGNPLDSLNDQPITIPDPEDSTKTWRPKNYEKNFDGNMTMRAAFYKSKNLPAIKLGIKYGLNSVVNYARRFGLQHRVVPVPAIGIGAVEATLMEMTSAYTVFPGQGVRPEPYFIENIRDKNDGLIYQNLPRSHETIRPEVAYVMLTMMQDVNIRGTAAGVWASGFNWPSGGKTGTTNDETDAWYIGFTDQYTTGVWIGTDDHKPLGRGHTGTKDALPIWIGIMAEIHKGLPKKPFKQPAQVIRQTICDITGNLAGDFCPRSSSDYFIAGNEPPEKCDGSHVIKRNLNNISDAFSAPKKTRYQEPEGEKTKARPVQRNTF